MLRKNADRTLELIDGMFSFLQSADRPRRGQVRAQALPLQKEETSGLRGLDVTLPTTVGFLSIASMPRALLVEDSAASVMITSYFLKMLKYSFDVAKNSVEALDKFSKNHYDVIIMDIQLPGDDGIETTRLIREIERIKKSTPTPILAVTGNATEDDRLICAKAGMNDYMTKPFEVHELEKKLNSIIDQNPDEPRH